jgi:thymidine kinase
VLDDRYGENIIKSRTGSVQQSIPISPEDDIYELCCKYNKIHTVLIDEIQFFTIEQVDQIIKVVDELNIPVICYGLKSDYKLSLFKTSAYLLTVADEIEEIKTICSDCGENKAIFNARINDGKIIITGDQIDIGGNDKYKHLCRKCFNKIINKK